MTDPIRMTTLEDVVSAIPGVLGFVPDHSVVVVAGRAPVFFARIDTPTDKTEVALAAADLAVAIRRNAPDGPVMLVAFGILGAIDDLAEALAADATLHVDDDNTIRRLRPGMDGEPVGVFRQDTPTALRLAVEHGAPARSRAERAAELEAAGEPFPLGEPADLAWVLTSLPGWLEAGQVDDADAGTLTATLADPDVRDHVLACLTRANAAAWLALFTDLARRAPASPGGAAVATLAGFASWLTGDGAFALMAIDRARELTPGYTLAGLLEATLRAAVPPAEWDQFVATLGAGR